MDLSIVLELCFACIHSVDKMVILSIFEKDAEVREKITKKKENKQKIFFKSI